MRVVVVAAVVERDGQVLITRRTSPPALKGLWEFPGGKVEEGEQPTEALHREMDEELEVEITLGEEIVAPEGTWPVNMSTVMRVWWASTDGDPGPGEAHDEVRWVTRDELAEVDWVPADRAVAERVRQEPWPSVAEQGC